MSSRIKGWCRICRDSEPDLHCHNRGCKARFHLDCLRNTGQLDPEEDLVQFICRDCQPPAYKCAKCHKDTKPTTLVECVLCNDAYHKKCVGLDDEVETDEWKCQVCVAKQKVAQKSRPSGGTKNNLGNVDICYVCQKGGKILCCNTCDQSFHPKCIDPEFLELTFSPEDDKNEGKWSCPICKGQDPLKNMAHKRMTNTERQRRSNEWQKCVKIESKKSRIKRDIFLWGCRSALKQFVTKEVLERIKKNSGEKEVEIKVPKLKVKVKETAPVWHPTFKRTTSTSLRAAALADDFTNGLGLKRSAGRLRKGETLCERHDSIRPGEEETIIESRVKRRRLIESDSDDEKAHNDENKIEEKAAEVKVEENTSISEIPSINELINEEQNQCKPETEVIHSDSLVSPIPHLESGQSKLSLVGYQQDELLKAAEEIGKKKSFEILRDGIKLKAYQRWGVNWLLDAFENKAGAILADEMGLGKTIQTLAFLCALKCRGVTGPHLVVVPLSTVGNWARELRRFTSQLSFTKICGSRQEREHSMNDGVATYGIYDLYITTYETCVTEEWFFTDQFKWQCVILDEAHRIKNEAARIRHSLDRVDCNMRVLLTGTPLQNNVKELFTLLNFLYPDVLSASKLMEEAFNADTNKDTKPHPSYDETLLDDSVIYDKSKLRTLGKLLSNLMLRRTKDLVVRLPKKIEHDIWLPLSSCSAEWYRRLIEITSDASNSSIRKLLGAVIKMRICCCHPRALVSKDDSWNSFLDNFKAIGLNELTIDQIYKDVKTLKDNSQGWRHIGVSSKLIFLDKLLRQLHKENMKNCLDYESEFLATRLNEISKIIKERKEKLDSMLSSATEEDIAQLRKEISILETGMSKKEFSSLTEIGCISKEDEKYRDLICGDPSMNESLFEQYLYPWKPRKPQDEDATNETEKTNDATNETEKTNYATNEKTTNEETTNEKTNEETTNEETTNEKTNEKTNEETTNEETTNELKNSSCQTTTVEEDPEELILDLHPKILRPHKVLIFSQFQLVLNELEEYCKWRGWRYMRLDGSTNKMIRELDTREFNCADSNFFIYLISTRAGGLGINLVTANHVVLYDEDWNPWVDRQAIDRAHRIGQNRNVLVWRLTTEWTVEERMSIRRQQKLKLDKLLIQANVDNKDEEEEEEEVEEEEDLSADKLSSEEIRRLIQYGRTALMEMDFTDEVENYSLEELMNRKRRDLKEIEDDKTKNQEEGSIKDSEEIDLIEVLNDEEKSNSQTDIARNDENVGDDDALAAALAAEEEEDGRARRPKRERKKPKLLYNPIEWREKPKIEKRIIRERRCFCCGDGGPPVQDYVSSKDKSKKQDDVKMDPDVEPLIGCMKCPKVYHLKTCALLFKHPGRSWLCPWHECSICARRSAAAGGVLIHCAECPTSFCFDCFPPEYRRYTPPPKFFEHLQKSGWVVTPQKLITFLCSKCKALKEQERRRKLSKHQLDSENRVRKTKDESARDEARKAQKAAKDQKQKEADERKMFLENKKKIDDTTHYLEVELRKAFEELYSERYLEYITMRRERLITEQKAMKEGSKAEDEKNTSDEDRKSADEENQEKTQPQNKSKITKKQRVFLPERLKDPGTMLRLCENCLLPKHTSLNCPFPQEVTKQRPELVEVGLQRLTAPLVDLELIEPNASDGAPAVVDISDDDVDAKADTPETTNLVSGKAPKSVRPKSRAVCAFCLSHTRPHARRHCEKLQNIDKEEYSLRRMRTEALISLLKAEKGAVAPTGRLSELLAGPLELINDAVVVDDKLLDQTKRQLFITAEKILDNALKEAGLGNLVTPDSDKARGKSKQVRSSPSKVTSEPTSKIIEAGRRKSSIQLGTNPIINFLLPAHSSPAGSTSRDDAVSSSSVQGEDFGYTDPLTDSMKHKRPLEYNEIEYPHKHHHALPEQEHVNVSTGKKRRVGGSEGQRAPKRNRITTKKEANADLLLSLLSHRNQDERKSSEERKAEVALATDQELLSAIGALVEQTAELSHLHQLASSDDTTQGSNSGQIIGESFIDDPDNLLHSLYGILPNTNQYSSGTIGSSGLSYSTPISQSTELRPDHPRTFEDDDDSSNVYIDLDLSSPSNNS